MCERTFDTQQCLLRSRTFKFRDVFLPDHVPVIIGRGPQTKIRDRKCSKNQVQITADYEFKKAVIQQLGPNPSQVQNRLLLPPDEVQVPSGASVNLIADDLQYTLEFLESEPQPRTKHKHHLKVSPNVTKKFKVATSPSRDTNSFTVPSHDNSWQASEGTEASNCHSSVIHVKDKESSELVKSESMQKTMTDAFRTLSTTDHWEEYDHSKILIFTPAGLLAQSKIAAFDMDNTIIGTQSGKVFPTSTDDWKILYAEIPGRLKQLHGEGFKLVLFTNQKGISRGRTSAPDFKRKVQRIVQKLGVPIQAMVSTGSGKYRKPNTGMWDYFVQKCNHGIEVDLESCLYVGDAAGRPDNWAPKKKKDFSCADRLFALNIGIKFSTPEEYFLGQRPASYRMPNFDPRNLKSTQLASRHHPPPVEELNADTIISTSPEVIVFVGFPAAGKSHFAQTYLIPKGYVHINRDTLGSWQKCVAEGSKALSSGHRIVIDNTNPDIESRSRYVELAKKCNVPCRCFLFVCSLEQAKHNNVFRELRKPDEKHNGVNDMVLNSYKSKFKEPTMNEGFSSVIKINFVPKFKNKHEEKLFRRFLLEK